MSTAGQLAPAFELRVRGRVQGVGFRPTVCRVARALGLSGEVLNDGEGVIVRLAGGRADVDALLEGVARALPRLARIEAVETRTYLGELPTQFRIAASAAGGAHTQIAPDAAVCEACAAEAWDPRERRYRYPFTNCTHCGPRLSIVTAIPYDRATTTMAPFPLCPACEREYEDPNDRRFHAEPIACPVCGPRLSLISLGGADAPEQGDSIARAASLIRQGAILAVKGLGGYHLACDATNPEAVARLRRAKKRDAKPFALMARDMATIRRYAHVNSGEGEALGSAAAPIVLLRARDPSRLPEGIAPGLNTLGFMLPTTPLHLLLLGDIEVPLVMTSGNLSDEPPVIDDDEARSRLSGVADHVLIHDRRIASRVDDSVVRWIGGAPRVLRRARGYAPAPIRLPPGFETAPDLIAMGGELKATFCLVKDGQAILSQHLGDLEQAVAFDDYRRALALYGRLFDHRPAAYVVDRHPEYLSTKCGRARAEAEGVPALEAQHHHAHVAACLAENGWPREAPAVLGIVLDGLGFGDDGTIWGGEFLLADYLDYQRLARIKPIAMPGGAQAAREPWRNAYAHILAAFGWAAFSEMHGALELCRDLAARPRATLDAMIAKGVNSPLTSSCGRLFDAAAAVLGVCRERQAYEGEAAARLEALAEASAAEDPRSAYRFEISRVPAGAMLQLDPAPLWREMLRDLDREVAASTIALRFHRGLSRALVETAARLARGEAGEPRFDTIALSGGCFHNRLLFEETAGALRERGFRVLTHSETPAGDGGLALGQAAIGAARRIADRKDPTCASGFPAAS